ncbi:conserved hypothetical protein [Nitrosopumilaceae archaeon]|nr:conserved hypothetical protein [Nitrosopumilaceae archaeon]
MYFRSDPRMGLFKRGGDGGTKCKTCGTELHDPERLRRHMKKAHGNVPEKKPDADSGGGTW